MIVRLHSHRARDRMRQALGRRTQSYFHFRHDGDWHEVSEEEYELIKAIKGITRSRLPEGAMRHWSW